MRFQNEGHICSIGWLAGSFRLASAQAPVAVVEDVQGKVTGAEFMDYVAPGKVIKLGPAGMVVLSYMKSCWRETITGIGTVIVGEEQSMVHLGEVKAGKVKCDPSYSQLIDRNVGESAATVVRSIDTAVSTSPQLTLYGLSPVVEIRGRGKLVLTTGHQGRAIRGGFRRRFHGARQVLRLRQHQHDPDAGRRLRGQPGTAADCLPG